jgi:hypothetical protein
VVALANGPVVEQRGLEYRDELGDRHLQLGPERAHADRLAHLVEEADGILAENAADLLEGGADRWPRTPVPSEARRSRLMTSAAISARVSFKGKLARNSGESRQSPR